MDRSRHETRMLFAFDERDPAWSVVTDGVMGGVSSAALEVQGGNAVFRGELSHAFGGGFATVRSPARDLGLGGWRGVCFRARGDGRRYRFGVLEDDRVHTVGVWRREFATEVAREIHVAMRFADLVMTIRGCAYPERGALPAERVRSLMFGIADGLTGPFRLEVGPLVAFRDRAGVAGA